MKKCLLEADASGLVVRCQFPLEPIACYVGKDKMTSDTWDAIQFWAHCRLAREALVDGKVLVDWQFDAIEWEAMYAALHSMPQMFQLWACKQVWDIVGTNYLRSQWDKAVSKWCPSRHCAKETLEHVIRCFGAGQVKTLQATIGFVEDWLVEAGTDPGVRRCVVQYACRRGYKSMEEVCHLMGQQYKAMAVEQDVIGWRRFMEGMLSKKLVGLQVVYIAQTGEGGNDLSWEKQLVIWLLEVTHGQWIYRNIRVHDETQGTLWMREKELLQQEIEMEMELGFKGFLTMNCSLANVTLEDLEAGAGEQQEHRLLAVRAARKAKALMEGNAAVDTQPD